MIRQIIYKGQPLYFLADDCGQVWLGGWRDRATAEAREQEAEDTDWRPECMHCDVDIQMLDALGRLKLEVQS